jgi:hypothetical protein
LAETTTTTPRRRAKVQLFVQKTFILITKNKIAMFEVPKYSHPGGIRNLNLLFRWRRRLPLHHAASPRSDFLFKNCFTIFLLSPAFVVAPIKRFAFV